MSKQIVKEQSVVLSQVEFDLSSVSIGLGWDVREQDQSNLFDKLLGTRKEDFDLDVVAFLLDENEKIQNLGYNKEVGGKVVPLVGSDIIHFNNLKLTDETVIHTGDNDSGLGTGDDEKIKVRLLDLKPHYHKILIMASIYQGEEREQHFGMINNAFIRAYDTNGVEILRYSLSDEPAYNFKRSMVFAEVFRDGSEWVFKALGEAYESDSFIDILRDYVYLDQ